MDPRVQQFLLEKYGPAPMDTFVQNLQQNQPQPLPQPQVVQPRAPQPTPVETSQNVVPQVPSVKNDIGVLSDEELQRYGIRSPEELEALKQQRLQMGDDLTAQSNGNVLANMLAQASDNVNSSGNRIMAGNASNNAPGVAASLENNLKGQQARVQAFDDAHEKIGKTDYDRLSGIDDKRLKLQEMRNASEDRNAALKQKQQELDIWRKNSLDAKNERFNTEQDRKLDERFSRFGKAVSSVQAGARNAIGRSANTYLDSQAVLALTGNDEKQFNKLNPQQVFEVARAYDRVVSRGTPTAGATSHLIPKSALMNYATFTQYMSSNPQGANVGGFVKSMVDGAKREGAVAKAVADRAAGTVLASHSDLKKKDPERYYNILAARDQELAGPGVEQTLKDANVPQFGSTPKQDFSHLPPGMSFDEFKKAKGSK